MKNYLSISFALVALLFATTMICNNFIDNFLYIYTPPAWALILVIAIILNSIIASFFLLYALLKKH